MTTGDAIQLPGARMNCDTPGCGYGIEVQPRDIRTYIGEQCPKCSAVMVTEKTALEVESMLALVDSVNRAVGPVEQSGARAFVSARVDRQGEIAEVTIKRMADQ